MKPIPNNILRAIDPAERRRMGKGARTWDEVETAREAKSEKELQSQIANLLNQRDIWFSRSRMDRRATVTKGQPDFLFALITRWGLPIPMAFEVKIGKAEPTAEQIECHAHMRRNGWRVYVVRSLEQARELLG